MADATTQVYRATTLRITARNHQRLRRMSVETGVSIQAIMESLVDKALDDFDAAYADELLAEKGIR